MIIDTVESFLTYFESFRRRTDRAIRCVPPDHIEWSPQAGKWTCGDLIRHLAATERYMFAENAHRRPSRYPGCGRELADGYDAVLAFVDTCHAESVALFAELSDADLQARCTTPGGADLPVWKWLRAMIEHEAHHRGQLHLMLGMLGVEVPPLYGLTSEEVLARSEPIGRVTR